MIQKHFIFDLCDRSRCEHTSYSLHYILSHKTCSHIGNFLGSEHFPHVSSDCSCHCLSFHKLYNDDFWAQKLDLFQCKKESTYWHQHLTGKQFI